MNEINSWNYQCLLCEVAKDAKKKKMETGKSKYIQENK